MDTLFKLIMEDLQSAYERLTNVLEMSREAKDGNESHIMDAQNRVNEALSKVNPFVPVGQFQEQEQTQSSRSSKK